MAIKSIEELMSAANSVIGEDNSDSSLAFIEDLTDTLASMRAPDGIDWKQRYEENDTEWRQKYRNRFFDGPGPNNDTNNDPNNDPNNKVTVPTGRRKFEDLFKEE